MQILNIDNKININNVNVLIDAFVTHKNNSLVFIFNNYHHIINNTKINVDKTKISYENNILKYKVLNEYTNYNLIEDFNPLHFFTNRFHHEILVVDNFMTNYVINETPLVIKIELNDNDNNCIICKSLTIENTNNYFMDKKCVSTIYSEEYELIPLWVEYHKKIGFEKFIIYDNNFNENKINKLSILVENYKDDVFIIDANWNYWLSSYGYNAVGQCIQQNHCIWKYCPQFLLLSDLDEYVNVKNDYNLFDENKYIVSIPNWFFGCNHNAQYTYDNFIKILTKKTAITDHKTRRKCLIQSKYVDIFAVHCPIKFDKNVIYLNYDECYLNHYFIMSYKKRFCNCKQFCKIEDTTIMSIV